MVSEGSVSHRLEGSARGQLPTMLARKQREKELERKELKREEGRGQAITSKATPVMCVLQSGQQYIQP